MNGYPISTGRQLTSFCILIVPSTARWLSDREKAFIQSRLPINAPRAAEKDFNFREFINTLKDKKLWLFLLCWAFYTIGTTGLNCQCNPEPCLNNLFVHAANGTLQQSTSPPSLPTWDSRKCLISTHNIK